jgi:hypothetical protein
VSVRAAELAAVATGRQVVDLLGLQWPWRLRGQVLVVQALLLQQTFCLLVCYSASILA